MSVIDDFATLAVAVAQRSEGIQQLEHDALERAIQRMMSGESVDATAVVGRAVRRLQTDRPIQVFDAAAVALARAHGGDDEVRERYFGELQRIAGVDFLIDEDEGGLLRRFAEHWGEVGAPRDSTTEPHATG